jgi:hypothetical protein
MDSGSMALLPGATRRRHLTIACLILAASVVATRGMDAQTATGTATGTATSVRTRSGNVPVDSVRTRRERLLMRFDSLRNEFENGRLSDRERDAIARRMRTTMLALQESFGDPSVDVVEAFGANGEGLPDRTMFIAKRRASTGYLGLSFDGPNVDEMRDDERIIRFLDYPRIALVEPSSPAERAGILEGDTLIALNGSDVRDRSFSLTKLLVPRQRVRVRVRREGTPMDVRVTIAEAPGYVVSRMVPMAPMVMMPPTPAAMPAPPARVRVFARDVPPPATPGAVNVAPTPAVAMTWVMQDGVAGARLENISEGLGRALGTRYGVLVLRAAPGTPAFDSGLRDGDVILRAAGDTVRTVRELRQAIQDGDEDGVKLVVLRDKKQRDVTLRWRW